MSALERKDDDEHDRSNVTPPDVDEMQAEGGDSFVPMDESVQRISLKKALEREDSFIVRDSNPLPQAVNQSLNATGMKSSNRESAAYKAF